MKKLIVLLAAMLTFASTAFAEIGSPDKDLVFTPVKPCRILDTRGTGPRTGLMAANSTRTFYGVSSATNYTGQGGDSPDCTLPFTTDVAAIVLNFTMVTPATGGYITAYPGDVADVNKPLAATVNFAAGEVVGNNATLKISQTVLGGDFKVFTTSATHLVADIVGFYAKPVATALQCETTTAVTAPINSGPYNTSGGVGTYFGTAAPAACSSGYTQTSILCSSSNAMATASPIFGPNPTQCTASAYNNSGYTLYASRICCRIPGR